MNHQRNAVDDDDNMRDAQSKKALLSLARTYSEYSRTDCNQQIQGFDDSIEELLTRLDEYHGLLDMIRSDTSLCLQRTLPIIQTKADELKAIFDRIDKLEAFVGVVMENVSVLEKQVEKADSEMGSFSTVKKVITSIPLPGFLRSKKSSPGASPVKSSPAYLPPEIFKTSDYISPSGEQDLGSASAEALSEPAAALGSDVPHPQSHIAEIRTLEPNLEERTPQGDSAQSTTPKDNALANSDNVSSEPRTDQESAQKDNTTSAST